MDVPIFTEVECKSLLNRSGICDWTVNCYSGCEHGCLYCYARFATRFSHPRQRWGSFVDVKVNAARLLERQVRRRRPGRVFVSSVCDAWQPAEERYGLTRQCLEILLRHGFPLTLLTKSALARRDLDLLAGRQDVEFGVTITTLEAGLSRLFEPGASPPAERLALLEEAKRRGIKTYIFLGPLLPQLSDTRERLTSLLQTVREVDPDYLYVDRLNPRYGVWPSLRALLQEYFPRLTEEYGRILLVEQVRRAYARDLAAAVCELAEQVGLREKMTLLF
jgi:DNA repair photolyase